MPGPLGLGALGRGGADFGSVLRAGAGGLQKALPFIPAFQARVGNFDVSFDPQQAMLQRILMNRLGGTNQPSGLLGLLQSLSNPEDDIPPVKQTPTVQTLASAQLGLRRPLGLLQGPNVPFGRMA
jgi:hypothetical protein